MATQAGSYGFLGDQLSTIEKARLLQTVPLLANLGENYLLALARHGRDVRANPGDVLVREGDSGNELMLLLDGTAEVRHHGQALSRLNTGDYFGELSLLDGQLRSADVVAASPVRLLAVDHAAFNEIMASDPTMAPRIVQNLCRMIRSQGATPA